MQTENSMSSIKNPDRSYSVEKNAILKGHLYLVATPIGNLADLSERAIKTLSEVDFVAAEDTRNTALLRSRLGIKKPLISYYEHNKRERGEVICERIRAGESCALVTDAGTPAISDPGEDIVKLCAEMDIPVTAVPGPCAAIDALILSGLFTGRFAFEGFLSANKAERRKQITKNRLHKTVKSVLFNTFLYRCRFWILLCHVPLLSLRPFYSYRVKCIPQRALLRTYSHKTHLSLSLRH